MNKKTFQPLFRSLLLLSVVCCGCSDDDNYVYPSVLTELADAHVNSSLLVDHIVTDQDKTFRIENSISASDLQADCYYRALCIYEKSETQPDMAKIYSLKLVFAAEPLPAEAFTERVKTDPLSIESIWRGGKYLNIVALPKAQNIAHDFRFIEDSLTIHEGVTTLYLKLYHDRKNDTEAYEQKTYLSVPLESYSLQKGDSVYFRANTYDEGLKTWKFAY